MSNIQDFLNLLDDGDTKYLTASTTTVKKLDFSPLSFKQQKKLITNSLNGVAGTISFVKNLNEIIIENTGNNDLKIYDRVPIALKLKKDLSDSPIIVGDNEISIDDIISQYTPYVEEDEKIISADGFQVLLSVPTLIEENKYLSLCINELKISPSDDIGNNVSIILSYELPKFIKSFKFGENEILISDLSVADRKKIIDNIPAKITNQITDFILNIRSYDEKCLTYEGNVIDIDSNFFE